MLPKFEELLPLWWNQVREHAVIALNPDGTVFAWGGDAERMFGYSATEIVGHDFAVLFTPEDVEAGAPLKERQIADTGSVAEDDRWMQRRDGSRFWASGVLHALADHEGRILGYAKVLRNRTDVKGLLEGQQREIRQLQLADDRKNRFISTIAHELRNPLSALGTAAELLRLNPSDDESREFALSAISRQVQFCRRLIEDLLDLTRIQKGKLRVNAQLADLCEIIRAAAAEVRPLIDQKGQTIQMILGDDPVQVSADPDRLQQVFLNLIQNAAKYTHQHGRIWVKLFLDGKEAAVKIEDNGIGISPDVLPKIFDLFTQADESEPFADGGLGIGLSLVKDLVRLHDGTVQVRSDGLGRGSEFVVRLPLAGAQAERPSSPTAE
jgi:PAS domain S-box-containing protein